MLDTSRCVLAQAPEIIDWVLNENRGTFLPEVVEAFSQEAAKEYFWLDARFDTSPQISIKSSFSLWNLTLDMEGLQTFSELFRMIIDYRSRHTAVHSRSVAHIAEALANLIGFSSNGCAEIYVAGNLHDLGKLAVPSSILDKPAPLNSFELNIVKGHVYHTYRILKEINGLGDICSWAALHHECMDGSGYPFRLCDNEIPLGARIVSAADVFTALTETRFYREAMTKQDCLRIMLDKASKRKLDPFLVSLVEKNYEDLYELQLSVQRDGMSEYNQILREVAPFLASASDQTVYHAETFCA
jgi:HD-GYP domain-containing protein (c-di-GMP phosphodiesterase class II)